MPAIAAMSKVSMRACCCGYRAHGALLQVESIGESPVGAGRARDCRAVFVAVSVERLCSFD
jgi:hypothetical protein